MAKMYHASDVLYRGEARDFPHAMELVVEECITEATHMPETDPIFWTEEMQRKHLASLDKYKAQARTAEAIYMRVMKEAEAKVIAELRAAGGDMQQFADALESGDYSHLAI